MKIVVFGATGMVGVRVAHEATARGHAVTAVARSGTHPVVPVDVRDRDRVADLLGTADAAVGAVRPRPGAEASVPETTAALLDAAAATGTPLLVVGGAAPLRSPDTAALVVDDERFVPAPWRAIALASLTQLRVCEPHPARWTYLSPPALLEPGERTGRYRRGTTTLLLDADGRSRISAEDLAVAVLDELENPGGDRHFTVAY
ncbi:NAD(P)-dependent oxidoreductase [Nocardia farcinica]|uniref:NAD(P)-binding domain-containing protein n=2 Tax=Nocardia farcinica TaxID=37329 RepID=Q5YV70_NOCFA|nr:NAD(P)H-binding protein [Nocardia farcinica]BAD57921.1 hypothetical protein NFA_30740 [Nocardia farcinica IFM 10152]